MLIVANDTAHIHRLEHRLKTQIVKKKKKKE